MTSTEGVQIWDGSGYDMKFRTAHISMRKFGGLALFCQGSKGHISFILIKIGEVSDIEEKEDRAAFEVNFTKIFDYVVNKLKGLF